MRADVILFAGNGGAVMRFKWNILFSTTIAVSMAPAFSDAVWADSESVYFDTRAFDECINKALINDSDASIIRDISSPGAISFTYSFQDTRGLDGKIYFRDTGRADIVFYGPGTRESEEWRNKISIARGRLVLHLTAICNSWPH